MDVLMIDAINRAIEDWFIVNRIINIVPAKELMPIFIEKHIFKKDDKDGLPIRKVLRALDKTGRLSLIPAVHAVRKAKNTNWFFIRPAARHSVNAVYTQTKAVSQRAIIHSALAPLINDNSTILILGSLPGAISLAKQQYYANPGNQFWKIMNAMFGNMPEDYDAKCKWLLSHEVALWDVLASASREGSLDRNIKNEVVNDFESFFVRYPRIRLILFNGTKAKVVYEKSVAYAKTHQYVLLPSSSGARAINIDAKAEEWIRLIGR